jgi:hypothetical protein
MQNKFSKKKNKVKKVKIMYGGLICPNPSNKAYIMLGHGDTTGTILDVPNDCVYVTTTLCGNVSIVSHGEDFYSFFKNNPEIVKNPCSYSNFKAINRIVSKDSKSDEYISSVESNYPDNRLDNTSFLNMHISRTTCETSAKCPKDYLFHYKDAVYLPCGYWFYKDNIELTGVNIKDEHNRINLYTSGLISSDNSFNNRILISLIRIEPWKYPMLTYDYIRLLYKYSVYPTLDDILSKITELNIQTKSYLKITNPSNYYILSKIAELNRLEKTMLGIIAPFETTNYVINKPRLEDKYIISGFDFVKMMKQHFTRRQSELFKSFPGVHYNTICRPFYEPQDIVVSETYSKEFQRQTSVGNKENLLKLYDEESAAEATDSAANSSCKKCNTPVATSAAAAAGIACCLGSMGDSVPVTAAASGEHYAPKIQRMDRGGGKKNNNKTKSKKYYKNKTKRSYKNKPKRSYKK